MPRLSVVLLVATLALGAATSRADGPEGTVLDAQGASTVDGIPVAAYASLHAGQRLRLDGASPHLSLFWFAGHRQFRIEGAGEFELAADGPRPVSGSLRLSRVDTPAAYQTLTPAAVPPTTIAGTVMRGLEDAPGRLLVVVDPACPQQACRLRLSWFGPHGSGAPVLTLQTDGGELALRSSDPDHLDPVRLVAGQAYRWSLQWREADGRSRQLQGRLVAPAEDLMAAATQLRPHAHHPADQTLYRLWLDQHDLSDPAAADGGD